MVAIRVLSLLVVFAIVGCKAAPGSRCFDEGSAQCEGATMLVCKAHKWEAVACAGPKGCVRTGRFVDCDESVAAVGAPCSTDSPDGYSGCSPDHKVRLKCDAGTWREDIPCRGPKGCVVTSRFVDCDDSVGMIGDACDADSITCAMDSKSVLACRGGKYVIDAPCPPGKCTVVGNTVGCE